MPTEGFEQSPPGWSVFENIDAASPTVSKQAEVQLSIKATRKTGRGLTLRPATLQDHDQIVSLEARYGLHTASYDEWSHLWLSNPAYRELQGGWSIGWLLEDDDRRIVGSIANIPLLYELEGQRVLATSARSWVAEREFRSAALLLLDRVINQPDVDLYLNSTFGIRSVPCISVFKCERVPVGAWDEAAIWITDHLGFAESVLRHKSIPLVKPLSIPLAAAMLLKDRLTGASLRRAEVEVKACAAFDDRFDDFWAALRRRSPHLLLAVRTREVLEWRYRYTLLKKRLWVGIAVEHGSIVAYAIFVRKDNPFGLKRVRLLDFQSLDGETALLPSFLAWALQRCKEEGIYVLESVGRWLEKGALLDSIAPHRRRLPAWSYVYRANNPALAEHLRDKRVWAPSHFDGDASLVN